MSNQDDDEPLLGELGVLPDEAFSLPQASPEFRAELLTQTSKVLRGRTRRRQALAACVVCLTYTAGIATVLLWRGTPAETPASGSVNEPAKALQTELKSPLDDDPRALLARVPDVSRTEQIGLLTKAGDLYLTQRNDVERALYCYRQVLELSSMERPIRVDRNDTWLLSSLKSARIKETTNEKSSS